jgi:S1-C subfamily serine protease
MWGLRLGAPATSQDSPGVPIVKIHDGSPADRAGLKAGDVLVTLDGRWTTSIADVYQAASEVVPGHKVVVVVHRDGKEVALIVAPAEGA